MSVGTPIRAFLISDGTRPGSALLEANLRSIVDLSLIRPVYLQPESLEDPDVVDRDAFCAYHLRVPSLGEVGCAIAHRDAQAAFLLSESSWVLIFEDDAMISNPGVFARRFETYDEQLDSDVPTVVNVNVNAIPRPTSPRRTGKSSIHQVSSPPYPATAYAINRSAAELFVLNQRPVCHQADWPTVAPEVRFFVDLNSTVLEDVKLDSRIDKSGARKRISLVSKVSVWTGLWYLQNRRHFSSFKAFWYALPRRRIGFHSYRLGVYLNTVVRAVKGK